MRCLKFMMIAVVWMVAVPTARAFDGGNGHNGPLVVAASATPVTVNTYTKVTASVVSGATSVTVTSTTGFAVGDSLLIWQVNGLGSPALAERGARIQLKDDANATTADVGRYELRRVKAVTSATVLTVDTPFAHAYDATTGTVQVVFVPEYSTLTINSGATITGTAWNGEIGGIAAVRVKGLAKLDGTISAAGKGFRGGIGQVNVAVSCAEQDEAESISPAKNGGKGESHTTSGDARYLTRGTSKVGVGGGGGKCNPNANTTTGAGAGGGGGGGHAGAGSQAGNSTVGTPGGSSGFPGVTVSYAPDHFLSMGGGGGGAHHQGTSTAMAPITVSNGGVGGGVVWLVAGSVEVATTGLVTVLGGTPIQGSPATGTAEGGGGGGGAGGLIYVESVAVPTCATGILFNAAGGVGASGTAFTNAATPPVTTTGGAGGSGGGGFIYKVSGASVDDACGSTAAGGAAGASAANGGTLAAAGAAPGCGDGTLDSHTCDDGNLKRASGDGCSHTCFLEAGFTCTGAPTNCTSNCGDGMRVGAEGCDDGNTAVGDGCNSLCTAAESGYSCTTATPNVCTPICGDGTRLGSEACDDGNKVANDGCDNACKVGFGYTCTTDAQSVCTSKCGDGDRASNEACDDKNTLPNDGCSAACAIEPGYSCTTASPNVCGLGCGNGALSGAETCDDKNLASGDGCSAACAVEPGYSCTSTAPSVCTVNCGDGLLAGTEECDDGPNRHTSGDGCSAACEVEPGFICKGEPSTCTFGSLVSGGDGCSASGATGVSQAVSYALAMLVLMASAMFVRRRRRAGALDRT